MWVGVLGGGLQGCCTALALAERGLNVVLLDQNQALLERTAVANEGKIHLGYMYAGDPTLSTARIMMEGALAFAPFMERYLGTADLCTRNVSASGLCCASGQPTQRAGCRPTYHGDGAPARYAGGKRA